MANPNYSKAYTADVDIAPYLILKAGSADGFATVASAATDALIGVSENVPVPAGRVVDVIQGGPANVVAGGAIAAGDYLTSDANGKAIKAAPASGTVANVIGKANVSAVAGDIFPYTTAFSQIHG